MDYKFICKKNVSYIYKLKQNLALNNEQWLACRKTKPNKMISNFWNHSVYVTSANIKMARS